MKSSGVRLIESVVGPCLTCMNLLSLIAFTGLALALLCCSRLLLSARLPWWRRKEGGPRAGGMDPSR